MNVGELIARLQKYPATARVVTPHFERGYEEIVDVTEQPIIASGETGFGFSAFRGSEFFDQEPFQGEEVAVVVDWTGEWRRDSADRV